MTKVKSVNKKYYKGKVYNLGTPPNHTYVANNHIVHNCYQNSDKNGEHASMEQLEKIADYLKELNVFEVAIGGGEPSLHPKFFDILDMFSEKNIMPNITTFTTNWIKKYHEKIDNLMMKRKIGGIGISVHNEEDLDKILDARKNFGFVQEDRFVAQHVVGSVHPTKTFSLLNRANKENIHVLLLGFKEVGKGGVYDVNLPTGFEEMLVLSLSKKLDIPISVDTCLLQQFPNLPKRLGVDKKYYTVSEGKFSMYIDAVEGKIGPSSYVDKEEQLPIALNNDGSIDNETFMHYWNRW